MIYADTSFWLGLRCRDDALHVAAKRFYGSCQERLIWSPWHRVEVFNGFRQLARPGEGLTRPQALAFINLVDGEVRRGLHEHREADWRDVLARCQELSTAHALNMACRSADLLHVAYALEVNAEKFVTGDADQSELAAAAGLATELLE